MADQVIWAITWVIEEAPQVKLAEISKRKFDLMLEMKLEVVISQLLSYHNSNLKQLSEMNLRWIADELVVEFMDILVEFMEVFRIHLERTLQIHLLCMGCNSHNYPHAYQELWVDHIRGSWLFSNYMDPRGHQNPHQQFLRS